MKPRRRNIIAALAAVCRFLSVSLLAGLVAGAALSAEVQRPPVNAAVPGLPFAIADFDGDLQPDLASVQLGSSDSTHSIYWIQLHLTAIGRQSIRLVAPVGGLQLLARDVNGDHAIDLVVMTAGLGEPVAVLLNDGHGGFSQADNDSFPGAFGNSAQNFASPENSQSDAAGIPPQPRLGISSQTRELPHPRPGTNVLAQPDSRFPLDSSLICHPSRAPPLGIS
jgi:hypothetical protein